MTPRKVERVLPAVGTGMLLWALGLGSAAPMEAQALQPPPPPPAGSSSLPSSPDIRLLGLSWRPLLPDPYADPAASLAILDRLREEHPEDPQYLVATAREASALGTLAETREDRRRYLRRAVEAARTAVALAPDRAETRYWLAASLGLLADQEGVRAKISLALEAHRQARETLRLDSLHGGGHHILGRLHAGARRLSWASRIIARGLGLGDILEEASWESAERHMRWAVERDPGQLVHFYELGKLLVEERGGREEGLALLEDLAKRVPRHPVDSLYSDRAGRALKRYRGG